MSVDLYKKRNGRFVNVLYPVHGTRNILQRVTGVKIRSFTGPSGKGIAVQDETGRIRSLSVSKCVSSL